MTKSLYEHGLRNFDIQRVESKKNILLFKKKLFLISNFWKSVVIEMTNNRVVLCILDTAEATLKQGQQDFFLKKNIYEICLCGLNQKQVGIIITCLRVLCIII